MFVLALAFRVQRWPLLAGRWKLQMRQQLINDAFSQHACAMRAWHKMRLLWCKCYCHCSLAIFIWSVVTHTIPSKGLQYVRCGYPISRCSAQTHVSSATVHIFVVPDFLFSYATPLPLRPTPPTIPPSYQVLLTHPPPQALPLIVCEIWRPDGRWGISPFDLWERGGVDGGYPFLLPRSVSAWWILPANSYYSFGLVPLISLCSIAMFWMCEVTKIK